MQQFATTVVIASRAAFCALAKPPFFTHLAQCTAYRCVGPWLSVSKNVFFLTDTRFIDRMVAPAAPSEPRDGYQSDWYALFCLDSCVPGVYYVLV